MKLDKSRRNNYIWNVILHMNRKKGIFMIRRFQRRLILSDRKYVSNYREIDSFISLLVRTFRDMCENMRKDTTNFLFFLSLYNYAWSISGITIDFFPHYAKISLFLISSLISLWMWDNRKFIYHDFPDRIIAIANLQICKYHFICATF